VRLFRVVVYLRIAWRIGMGRGSGDREKAGYVIVGSVRGEV